MKKITAIILSVLVILSILPLSISAGALTYSSIKKNTDYHYGIDVSQWNGDLDWNYLKEIGVEFAYIRLGYYYSKGGTLDKRFKQNIKDCAQSGIDFGVYVYSHVYKYEDTVNCAKWINKVLSSMGNYTKDKDTINVAYDIEDDAQINAVTKGKITKRYLHNGVQKFCNKIKAFGYVPVVYASQSFYFDYLYLDDLQANGVKIWCASWPYKPNTKVKKVMDNGTNPDIWQFASSYTINDVVFDTNVCYEDFYDYNNEDSSIIVKGLKSSYSYKKSGVIPDIKVYDNDVLLQKDVDYKIVYFNNNRTGKARLKIIRYNNGEYQECKTFSFIVSPIAVKNLSAVPLDDEITLKWDKLNGAHAYQIYEYDETDNTYNLIDKITTNSYTDYFLEEGREYKLRVRAAAKIDGKTVYGNNSDITVITKYKSLTLNAESIKKKTVNLTWKANSEKAKGYIIEYSDNKSFNNKNVYKITEPDKGSVKIKDLQSKAKYYFRIRSYNKVSGKTVYSLYGGAKSIMVK